MVYVSLSRWESCSLLTFFIVRHHHYEGCNWSFPYRLWNLASVCNWRLNKEPQEITIAWDFFLIRVDISYNISIKSVSHNIADWLLFKRNRSSYFPAATVNLNYIYSFSRAKRRQGFFRETLPRMVLIPNNNREFYIYPWMHMSFVVKEKRVLLH